MANQPVFTRSTAPWLAVAIWIALLAALVVTSGYSISPILNSGASLFTTQALLGRAPVLTGGIAALVIYTILVAVFISLVVRAWLTFAALTTDLIVAYASGHNGDVQEMVFSSWLVFPDEQPADETPDEPAPEAGIAESTSVSRVVHLIAYMWGVLLALPAAVAVARMLFPV